MRAIALGVFALAVLAACEPSSGKAEPEAVSPPTTAHPVDLALNPLDSGSVVDAAVSALAVTTTPDAGVDAGPVPPSTCVEAKTRSGMACSTLDKQCSYPDHVSCACEMTSCSSPAGPTPNCTSVPAWSCRSDGCPKKLAGAACTTEGKKCRGEGFCIEDYTCKGGKFLVTYRGECAPAAPPQGGNPPQLGF